MADTPNTDHALQLAMFMQRRDAMQFGVVNDGEVLPTWEDSGLAQHEYIADAEVILRAVGTLGYGQVAEVQAERDAALAVIEQVRELRDEMFSDLENQLHTIRLEFVIERLDPILAHSPASALAKGKADALRAVAAGLGENQTIREGDVKEALRATADRIEKEATGD